MRTLTTLTCIAAALLTMNVGASPADPDLQQGPVLVEFIDPGSFTDARIGDGLRKGASKSVTSGLTSYLSSRAASHLEAGQLLHIEFTDVDLAGDYEPSTRIALQDVRIVKSVYPPRLEFRWELKDATGATLRAGEENLRDLGFQTHVSSRDSDPLRYEKHVLKRWLRDTFPREG
jgi:hypothetical protein